MYSEKWARRIYEEFEYIHGTRTIRIIYGISEKYRETKNITGSFSYSDPFFLMVKGRIFRMIQLSKDSQICREGWELFKQAVKRPDMTEFYQVEMMTLLGDFLFKQWYQRELGL